MTCPLCQKEIDYIDYLDTQLLEQFIDELGEINPRRKTYLCQQHQNKIKKAIKRARHLSLLPYTTH